MNLQLDDDDKQFVLKLIDPALTAITAALMYRSEVAATEENADAATDAVCDFLCEYYAKG